MGKISFEIQNYVESLSEKGLTHYLMDATLKCDDVIETVSEYGFDMVHSGVIPPNPSELLMSDRFQELINYGKEHYDFVIVDTPPILLITDSLVLLSKVDRGILVMNTQKATKQGIQYLEDVLSQNNLNYV